ncbi:HD domain-containing protein [Bacillus sp. HMF5848]|uniref:HD-GYP domain-containing protein n=1 Tax=Bacillus sp. HMF5848 TaxID=2495421 RepID=UPI000F76B56B|nr:HD domain-containing phosphohydrolase [Bacillus sp. HMF5848]RSK26287.1 HD domain-containing protein [Bacillus sp. HMF5848]
MRYCLVDNIEQGEKLARPIFTSDGRVLLGEGVLLTVGLIARLHRMGVQAVYIQDDRYKDISVEEIVSEETRRETVSRLSESFQYIQDDTKGFQLKTVSKQASSIVDEIMLNKDVLVNLSDIRTKDNCVYYHSVTVCIMAIVIGIKLGLDRGKLRDLAIGALFHDIGKTLMGSNDHTWKGFNAIRQNPEFSRLSAVVALQHHENIDGSGYPRQIRGEEIHIFSKIVAVVNYYDNLVSPREETKGLYPYEACERVMALTNKMFEHEIVWTFLRSIAFYPTGCQVKLTTGETGMVYAQNHGLPQRPVIRVFKSVGKEADDYETKEVDLAKETTIFIKEIIAK